MAAIPRSALLLGLAGLIPFVASAVLTLAAIPLPGTDAPVLAAQYGLVILAFMSGVLWGFATRATGRTATMGYGVSVIPALWGFFTTLGSTTASLVALMIGFAGLLLLDRWFWQHQLAPAWWMRLRLLLTGIVLACLVVVTFFS